MLNKLFINAVWENSRMCLSAIKRKVYEDISLYFAECTFIWNSNRYISFEENGFVYLKSNDSLRRFTPHHKPKPSDTHNLWLNSILKWLFICVINVLNMSIIANDIYIYIESHVTTVRGALIDTFVVPANSINYMGYLECVCVCFYLNCNPKITTIYNFIICVCVCVLLLRE